MSVKELGIPEVFQQYFFSGYTILNTLIYGIILVIIIFGIIKMFEYLDINPVDLIFPLIPFIFLGSGVRALVDNGRYPYNIFLITPGIYFVVGSLAIVSVLFGVFLQKKRGIDYRYVVFIIGTILAILNLINIHYINLIASLEVLGIWIIISGFFVLIGRKWSLFKEKTNLAIISAHIFDASSTFIAVDFFGYYEQHVLPNSIYNVAGTAITMFPLKIIVIVSVLYLIDKYIDDEIIKGTLKLTIFILGLAPGIRNFLSLAIGTAL